MTRPSNAKRLSGRRKQTALARSRRDETAAPSVDPGVAMLDRQLDRSIQHYTAPWGVIPALAAIPVVVAHGVPEVLAVVLGCLLAAGFLAVTAVRPPTKYWLVLGLLTIADFWPGFVFHLWFLFAGMHAACVLLMGVAAKAAKR